MGANEYEQPHVRRSSSMSFALRWKHENLRLISIVAFISIAITFMFLMMLYSTATKRVSVVINGQESVVYTKQWILQRLLDEQGISIGEHDRLSTSLDAKVKTGDQIHIDQAKPLQLTADGEVKTLYTAAKTVGDALQELNVSLGELDKVSPELDAELSGTREVQIVRVQKTKEEFSEKLAFAVEKTSDSQLPKGKQQIVQEGKEGVIVKTKEKLFEDGKLVSEVVVDQQIQSERVNKIVAIGTKNPVTVLSASAGAQELSKSGLKFNVKQVINNVTLTAYSAGESSTGKSSEHPQYGLTATGTRVMEGRTIAVDPTVIPLGWWVYIDGLGFRRAEDIGSGVKGNKVDVYFDSNDYANRFGMKRGNTIYVIGPNKPVSD